MEIFQNDGNSIIGRRTCKVQGAATKIILNEHEYFLCKIICLDLRLDQVAEMTDLIHEI